MAERVAAAWQLLPEYLGAHILLSASALALGLIVSLLLAFAAIRSARLRVGVLLFASVVQTIPGLALLALFYPLLLALSALAQRTIGVEFSALGFLPSLLALTLYSMLPIVRNGVTGVLSLDPAYGEAAYGVGMTEWQRLRRVELPLAMPMLMAGVRTSAVWVIGAATLSTPVGQASLGNYIFSGLQVQDWVAVLFGCIAAAALALTVDQLLAIIEAGVANRRPARIATAVAVLAAGVLLAALPRGAGSGGYVVGAKNFSEQFILAALIGNRIAEEGGFASRREGLGSSVIFTALATGDLDVYVDYSGTLWANVLGRSDTLPRVALLDALRAELAREHGAVLLGPLGFENAYALAMRRERAAELAIRTIDDLAAHAGQLTLGADLEFLSRPEWSALRDAYGLDFASRREFAPTFMYRAVESGDVDVVTAFSSDGRIAADDLVVLEDPRNAILPYDAVVLVAAARANDPVLRRALEPLIEAVPVELMREANYRVDRDAGESPATAARWLAQRVLGR